MPTVRNTRTGSVVTCPQVAADRLASLPDWEPVTAKKTGSAKKKPAASEPKSD